MNKAFTPHPWKILTPSRFSHKGNHYSQSQNFSDETKPVIGRYEKRNLPKVSGFTTIEMLVIIGILALLSATLILYSRTAERQINLFKEQAKITEIISQAKFLSIATYGKVGVPCGFGVHFEAPSNFLIFKDLAADCKTSDQRYSGAAEIHESFQLDSTIIFDSLSLSDIIFIPPDPKVIITPPQDEAAIIIKTIDGSKSITIKVTSAGQISTE